MCIILDNNLVTKFLANDPDIDPIWKALNSGAARLVHGGRLTREYSLNKKFFALLARLAQKGRAKVIEHTKVDAEEGRLQKLGVLQSDDAHVIALLLLSGVRLVATQDSNLMNDVSNKLLIDKPRGKIYQRANHAHLITQFCKTVVSNH